MCKDLQSFVSKVESATGKVKKLLNCRRLMDYEQIYRLVDDVKTVEELEKFKLILQLKIESIKEM